MESSLYSFDRERYTEVRHEDGRIELIPRPVDEDWAPGSFSDYWAVHGSMDPVICTGGQTGRGYIPAGNYFKTRESAARACEYLRLHLALIRAHELVEPEHVHRHEEVNHTLMRNRRGLLDVVTAIDFNWLGPAYSSGAKARRALALLKKWGF